MTHWKPCVTTSKSPSRDYKKWWLLRHNVVGGSHWLSSPIAEAKKRNVHKSLESAGRIQISTVSDVERCQLSGNQTEKHGSFGSWLSARRPIQYATICPSLNHAAVRMHIGFSQVRADAEGVKLNGTRTDGSRASSAEKTSCRLIECPSLNGYTVHV